MTPPLPWAQRLAAAEEGMGKRTRAVLAAVIGLWPVTAVVALAGALCWAAVMQGQP